jgi:acetamidase/formamidase
MPAPLPFSSFVLLLALALAAPACSSGAAAEPSPPAVPRPQFKLDAENTHNKFSSKIEPRLRVPSGAIVQVETKEATDRQLSPKSTSADVAKVDPEPIHPLTGPIYVEGADPGDTLAVTLHDIEIGDWGWVAVFPGFGFLAEEFTEPYLRTFALGKDKEHIDFGNGIRVPLDPFPGVMGVAPAAEEMLSTIPPRENGGNMDNRHFTAGTTVYFPVQVKGALFSIGDAHAAQGNGEVCGTALEAPMRLILELRVIEGGRKLAEPEYETARDYAVTAIGTTIDEAAKKATGFMVDYLSAEHGLERRDAYLLASLAADLEISEVVDMPHYLVSMHIPKAVLGPARFARKR